MLFEFLRLLFRTQLSLMFLSDSMASNRQKRRERKNEHVTNDVQWEKSSLRKCLFEQNFEFSLGSACVRLFIVSQAILEDHTNSCTLFLTDKLLQLVSLSTEASFSRSGFLSEGAAVTVYALCSQWTQCKGHIRFVCEAGWHTQVNLMLLGDGRRLQRSKIKMYEINRLSSHV